MFKLLRRKSTKAHLENLKIALSSGMVDFMQLRECMIQQLDKYSMMPHLFECSRKDASRYIFHEIMERIVSMSSNEIDDAKHTSRESMGFGKTLSTSEVCHNIFFAMFDQAGLAIPNNNSRNDGKWMSTKDGFLFSDVAGSISQICACIVSNNDLEKRYGH